MFDSENFICEVEARPPLYNVQLKEYSNKEVKATCWGEIGEALYEDWSTVSSSIKKERLVNFSLCKRKIVELIQVSVLKNVVCSGFFCDFLQNSPDDFVPFL